MLVEQIIEIQLRGYGPPERTCTFMNDYVHDKTKISEQNFRVDSNLLLKYCKRQGTLLSLPGPNHLQLKFNTKLQDLKRVLDLNCK